MQLTEALTRQVLLKCVTSGYDAVDGSFHRRGSANEVVVDEARGKTALGHEAKLMPPAYVKPYVKRQKNDAAEAGAICDAVQRPSMRFVPI
jgi:hypothetical protein